MDTITLNVTEGQYASAKEARADQCLPMNYYGKGVENRHFCVDYQEFRRAYEKGGRSTIYSLKTPKEEEIPVLVHEIQFDALTDAFHHIDLKSVDMKQKIRTQVPLVLVGVSPAVKDLGGVLIQNKDSVEVECLPKNLVHEIELDISSLEDFHSSISVGDIPAMDGIEILDAAEVNIAGVSAPRAAVEETAEEAAPAEGAGEAKAEGGEEEAPKEE